MSRSFKKVPITGWAKAESEKKDKQKANRKFRKKLKNKLREVEKIKDDNHGWIDEHDSIKLVIPEDLFDEVEVLPERLEEVSDVVTFAKDGKQYVKGKLREKVLRK